MLRSVGKDGRKLCHDCGRRKKVEQFGSGVQYRNRVLRATGKVKMYSGVRLYSYCKLCMSARAAKWRKANLERFREYQRDYYKRVRSAKKEKTAVAVSRTRRSPRTRR